MKQLLASLTQMADVVILDSPPVVAVTDAAVLSNRVDGVVLVTYAGQTRRDAARQAVLTLQQAGANLLGGVLNGASKRKGGYQYYHYYTPSQREPARQLSYARLRRKWQWLPFFK
jgi:Mrp family chromosome partitioning ATPase